MRRIWALIIAVVLGAAACSTTGEISVETIDGAAVADLTPQSLQAAASRTADVESARFAMTYELRDFPFFGDIEFSMRGAFVEGGERSAMIMDLGSIVEAIPLDELAPQERAMLEGVDLDVEYRQIGNYTYMRSDLFAQTGMVPAGRWVRIDAARVAEVAGLSAAEISQMSGSPLGTASATDFLAFLEGTGAELDDIGGKEIRDVETQGFAVTVNLRDVYAAATAEASEEIQGFMEQMGMGEVLDVELPMEVWVDDAGLVRRLAMDLDMGELVSGFDEELSGFEAELMGDLSMHIEIDMYDFGADVRIDEPVDFVDLTDEFLRGDF